MQFQREISYDRTTSDFLMKLDGKPVGFARTYQEAETILDNVVFDLLAHTYTFTAPIDPSIIRKAARTGGPDAALDLIARLPETLRAEQARLYVATCTNAVDADSLLATWNAALERRAAAL